MIDTKEIRKALAIHGVDVLNEDEVLDVLDHLEAAEKEIESWKGVAKQLGNDADTLRTHLSFAKDELNRLRTKIAEMENQEPVGEVVHNGESAGMYDILEQGTLLYSLPGAQPKLDEIKIALQRALELGKRETWTGARKHRSREDQREEQQCWNKVWELLDAKGE